MKEELKKILEKYHYNSEVGATEDWAIDKIFNLVSRELIGENEVGCARSQQGLECHCFTCMETWHRNNFREFQRRKLK